MRNPPRIGYALPYAERLKINGLILTRSDP